MDINLKGIGGLFLGAGIGTAAYLGYKDAKKARKQQEAQFQKLLEEYNKPKSDPRPLQQVGGGSVASIGRGSTSRKKRAKKGPSKANQGLLSMDAEPSLLGSR